MAILIHTVTEAHQRETNDGLQYLTVERDGSESEAVGVPGDYNVGDLVLVVKRLSTLSRRLAALLRVRPDALTYHSLAVRVDQLFPAPPYAPGTKVTVDVSAGSDYDFAALLPTTD